MSLGPGLPQPPAAWLAPLQAHRHQLPERLRIVTRSVLGGLHHEYNLEEPGGVTMTASLLCSSGRRGDGAGTTVNDTCHLPNQSHPEGEQAADLAPGAGRHRHTGLPSRRSRRHLGIHEFSAIDPRSAAPRARGDIGMNRGRGRARGL
jgi:hypothetical protein